MISGDVLKKLGEAFPDGVFVLRNSLFLPLGINSICRVMLDSCDTYEDVKCRMIEGLSRDAFKSQPYRRSDCNARYHEAVRAGLCKYLGRDFSVEDIENIYTYLGNGIRPELTRAFVKSGCDVAFLIRTIRAEAPAGRRKGANPIRKCVL